MITTEDIASLLAKAWPLSFTPVNIMAGFRKSGAFPLNPGEVTDRHIAPSKGVLRKEASPQVTAVSTSSPPASLALSPRSSCSFTSEQHELYQRRYAEGFDLPDPDYQRWVEMHHAEEIRSAESLVTHASGASIEERNSDALSDILSLPEPANDTRRRRRRALNSTAVTLTDDDILSSIKTKEANKLEKEAEKEKRRLEREQKKREREEKRLELEQQKREKQRAKKGRGGGDKRRLRSVNSGLSSSTPELNSLFTEKCVLSDSESDAECPLCGLTFLEDDSGSPWVCCDGCQSWYDFKCTSLSNPKRLPRKFFCNACCI